MELYSRPLTYISEDPEDLTPLTPAAFIQDIETSEFPEILVLNNRDFGQRYKDLLSMKEELRSRFRSAYLGQLVQRKKPTHDIDFEVGEIVFVVDDKKKRLEWSMVRIIELFPGNDKQIRVARIKTQNGELIISLQRLIPLEVKSTEVDLSDYPEAVKKSLVTQKVTQASKKIKSKNTVLVEDAKEIKTKSGRIMRKPLRLQFN